jgi:hypothetical protein
VAYPTLLAARSSDEFARLIAQLWSTGHPCEHDIQIVAHALLRSGVVECAMRQIHDEIDGAITALGDFSERPGGDQLAAWAKALEQRTEDYVNANYVAS